VTLSRTSFKYSPNNTHPFNAYFTFEELQDFATTIEENYGIVIDEYLLSDLYSLTKGYRCDDTTQMILDILALLATFWEKLFRTSKAKRSS
jgi:hypothetical protein